MTEAVAMDSSELERFQPLNEEMIQAMKLHGLRSKTIESYCCSIRRVAHFFNLGILAQSKRQRLR
jgi:integrase/recombinase XerD